MEKKQRTSAKSKFTRVSNKLLAIINSSRYLEADLADILFADLRNVWSQVESKHENYVLTIEDENQSQLEEEWIAELEQNYLDIRVKYSSFKSICVKEVNITNELVNVNLVESKFNTSFDALIKSIKSKNCVETISHDKENLRKIFEEFNDVLLTFVKKSDDVAKFNDMQNPVSEKFSIAMEAADNYIKELRVSERRMNAFKIDKFPLPKFDGNIRSYPRFKKDFTKFILPQISPSQGSFVLRQCLPEAIQSYLGACDEDLDAMFARMDIKFGDSRKLVELIISEIKTFPKIFTANKRAFISFVDLVESGYRDLKQLGMDDELSNFNVMGIIEGKLPVEVGMEWYRKIQAGSLDRKLKFKSLLDYLMIERNAVEYSLSDVRITTEVRRNDTTKHVLKNSDYCWIHNADNHDISKCKTFLSKTNEERICSVKENSACWTCLHQGHQSKDCPVKVKCNVDGCQKLHNIYLHEAFAAGIISHTKMEYPLVDPCILLIMAIPVSRTGKVISTLWDSGATLSLVTFDKARELNLPGKQVNLNITKTGGTKETLKSFCYTLTIKDRDDEDVYISAYGIPRISTDICEIKVENLISVFPESINSIAPRPKGDIDLLIGLDYASFHPQMVDHVGHLVLYRNRFGECVGGRHPSIKEGTKKLIVGAELNHFNAEITSEFFRRESMGVECQPLCGGCRCGKCPVPGKRFSLKEERELNLIEKGLTLTNNKWTSVYPWVRDAMDLPDNFKVAVAILYSTEKRLMKSPEIAAMYQDEIEKMVNNGFARIVQDEELRNHKGPIHYICHHEVLKPQSESTPCRIVFNTSQNFHGHIINEYWAKGPDLINNLLGVLLRFREEYIPICGDIRKMYHTISISYLDQHTHRFLWRNFDTNRNPDIYVMNVVSFGDKPAGSITMTALAKTAQLSEVEYPRACDTICNNVYVDDMLDSVNNVEAAEKLTNDIDHVLYKGSFIIKKWTIGNKTEQIKESGVQLFSDQEETQRVLGMNWDPSSDMFYFVVRINFSKKVKGLRSGDDLNECEVPDKVPPNLTKRDILSQINGVFDPMGLASAFTVRAKILWRELCIGGCNSLQWDQDIPENQRQKWILFFKEMFEMQLLRFYRCMKPPGAKDIKPILIIFSDASNSAFGACAYIRWELSDGTFSARLIAAKSKVCPVKIVSIVRSEMNGALLSKRLKCFIEKETRIKFAETFLLVDSQIVYSMLQRESYGFSTFIGLRVGEIQRSTEPSSWYWTERCNNVADWITKGKHPLELHQESIWQKGPEFLRRPVEEWPIYQTATVLEIPEVIRSVMVTIIQPDSLASRIDLTRFSSYLILIRTTARILSMYKATPQPSLYNVISSPSREEYVTAVKFWIYHLQSSFSESDMQSTYKRLSPQKREDGIWVVGSRAAKWTEFSYNNESVILLPCDSLFSRLYATHIHNIAHNGVSTTVSKIRLRFWVVRLAVIVKSIVFKCVTCRRNRKIKCDQIMADLPIERLVPSPPWMHVSLDYFGPYEVRGEVNKRSRGKVFGVIFNCLITRAVYLDVACSYSTDSFLKVLRRYVSLRGYPSTLMSDNGSQLVGASRELKHAILGLDWKTLKSYGAEAGMLWKFTSADSPWQNGCSEALIKSCKRSISHAVGVNVLSFSEIQTVLFEVANLMNERPIGHHPTDPADGSYLCPNDILLGRATTRVPSGPFKDYKNNNKRRFELIQLIANAFWRKMTRDFFPSLIIREKWHTSRRNVTVGDIVVMQDTNAVRGEWKIARVYKVYPDEKGVVRKCDVQYKRKLDKDTFESKFTTVSRAIQRLIVLVPANEKD